MSNTLSQVSFEQAGSQLTAVEIVRSSRAPIITSLHHTLVALGIVISSYTARTSAFEIMERFVFEGRDGGALEAQLGEAAKAAILALVTGDARTGAGDAHTEAA